jgi:hypothetical protein
MRFDTNEIKYFVKVCERQGMAIKELQIIAEDIRDYRQTFDEDSTILSCIEDHIYHVSKLLQNN